MASAKEIQGRIKSIQDTYKITNAMYMISSSKFQKAKRMKADAEPYFFTLQRALGRILHHYPEFESPYLESAEGEAERRKKGALRHCHVVFTADKGLAGAFNSNVLKLAQQQLDTEGEHSFFLIGALGRQYFERKGMTILDEYPYTTQNPSIHHARVLADEILSRFDQGVFDTCDAIFNCSVGRGYEARLVRVLPLGRENFHYLYRPEQDALPAGEALFLPSVEAVVNGIIPNYLTGFFYGALVESFSNEQNARMTAMDAANRSAKDMLRELSMLYNRVRQAAITQEITEVIGGAKKLKQSKQNEPKGGCSQ